MYHPIMCNNIFWVNSIFYNKIAGKIITRQCACICRVMTIARRVSRVSDAPWMGTRQWQKMCMEARLYDSFATQCLMGGWWDHYSLRCQPVDYSNSPTAIRVSRARSHLASRDRSTRPFNDNRNNHWIALFNVANIYIYIHTILYEPGQIQIIIELVLL